MVDRHYETVCIINPDAEEETRKGIVKKAASAVEKLSGKGPDVSEWGRKRLSYAIRKKKEGYYVLFAYTSQPEASKELERVLRYNEDVMRYQTVAVRKRPPVAEAVSAAPVQARGGENG